MSSQNDINKRMAAIRNCLRQKNASIHMLGICGVGMAGLAFLLKKRGFAVSGCDENPNRLAAWLKKHGIKVIAEHAPAHVAGANWIIRSTAVRRDNPEIEAARRKGKPIFLRGEVLAAMSAEGNSICVCGTHGKTTTTAMLAQLLTRANLKPSFCIGGEVPALGGVAGVGAGKHLVLEADESDGTLAIYRPSIAVITNIEFDHAEHFKDFSALKRCFAAAAGRTRGKIIYCFDDPQARKMLRRSRNAVSYGFSSGADLQLINYRENSEGLSFSLKIKSGLPQLTTDYTDNTDQKINPFRIRAIREIRGGIVLKFLCLNLTLPVPGAHNALNAAAACAVGLELGIPFHDITAALAEFHPVARRFEKIVENKDLLVISDYAHHPTEIAALIRNAKALKRKRWLAVFQPHRYTRTKALGKLFPPAFSGVAELVLCPVYAASESKIPGGTSWDLYEHFRRRGKTRTVCARSLRQAWDYLKTRLAPGDGFLIIGAGDINKIADWAGKELSGDKDATFPPICGSAKADNAQRSTFNPPRRKLKSRRSKLDVQCWMFNVSKFPGNRLKSSAVRFNEPLAEKTTLRVGGSADIYIEAGAQADLALIVKWAHTNRVPLKMLGAGSNVLVSDLGARGIVLRLKGPGWRTIERQSGTEIVVGGGGGLNKLTGWAEENGLTGAEFLAGIPGTIGGAVRMNAGAWGREMRDIVARVKIMDETGKIEVLDNKRLGFSYRSGAGLENKIVLEATLRLKKDDARVIHKRMSQIRERRKWMQGLRSAGSVFKNPAGDAAGRLIDRLALKGRTIGGAKISERHANVIVTGNNANASDVMALIEITRDLVRSKSGVTLENEIKYFE